MKNDRYYGRDLFDYLEVFDEPYIEMHDVFDLKLRVILSHVKFLISVNEVLILLAKMK
ncbi:MAG: hypothetical protein Q8M44_07285 [bacterium]|nr:hypothetical protein [bacterium]